MFACHRFKTSPHLLLLLVEENAATLFCHKAPEMFRGLLKLPPDSPSARGRVDNSV